MTNRGGEKWVHAAPYKRGEAQPETEELLKDLKPTFVSCSHAQDAMPCLSDLVGNWDSTFLKYVEF